MNMTLETIRAAHARIAPYIVRTPLLRLPAEEFQALAEGRQAAAPHPQLLVRRLPSQQIKAYLEAMKGVAEDPLQRQWEFYHRCRMLQDFVSGMTDQHAQDEYRALSAL